MHTRTDEIATPSGPMGVHVVRPEGDGPYPVIVFFHHGPGLDEGSKQTMARIAEWGYYVVSHDRYHRAEAWYAMRGRSDEDVQQMVGLVLGTTEDQVAEDRDAVLAWVASDPAARGGAMGCIGFCIGARSALCAIRDRGDVFRAGVGLHPSLCTTDDSDSPHLAVPSYTGSLYIAFGSADTMQPASANTALIDATNALAKGEAEIHDGANHGFGVYGPAYHDAAATRSFERAKVVFDRELAG
ncbi:MAG: dienelactone hydrolase family protein [Actinobacteria bacterium]|nr:dienelactone hydrolase family protein [Actinomycetota bacterium]